VTKTAKRYRLLYASELSIAFRKQDGFNWFYTTSLLLWLLLVFIVKSAVLF